MSGPPPCARSSLALRVSNCSTSASSPAASGTLYMTGVGETPRKGLVLPVTVTDAQVKHNLSRWPVVIDGEVDEKVCGRVRDNTIVLDSRGGLVFTIR